MTRTTKIVPTLVVLGVGLLGCGGSDLRDTRARSDEPPEQALDLLATWAAHVGLDDARSSDDFRGPGFEARETSADGERPDRTARLRVCGDPTMWVVDGGYDVALRVRTQGTDGVFRAGRRELEMRVVGSDLRLVSDRFRVDSETRPQDMPESPPVLRCEPRRRDCLVIFVDEARGEGARLEYPIRWAPPEDARDGPYAEELDREATPSATPSASE